MFLLHSLIAFQKHSLISPISTPKTFIGISLGMNQDRWMANGLAPRLAWPPQLDKNHFHLYATTEQIRKSWISCSRVSNPWPRGFSFVGSPEVKCFKVNQPTPLVSDHNCRNITTNPTRLTWIRLSLSLTLSLSLSLSFSLSLSLLLSLTHTETETERALMMPTNRFRMKCQWILEPMLEVTITALPQPLARPPSFFIPDLLDGDVCSLPVQQVRRQHPGPRPQPNGLLELELL